MALFKRFLVLFTAFCLLFSLTVSAEATVSLKPYGEFYVYGEDTSAVAEVLGMTEKELQSYCAENQILYLAVNEENSKQIRVTCNSTDFSNSVVNITGLSDDSINELIPSIAGIENVRGETVTVGAQKLVKIQLRSEDSGGEYTLTEYITIADKKCYILSFYTNADTDTDYIEKTFETYGCTAFLNDSDGSGFIGYIILAAAIIFAIATAVIVFTIVRDIRKEKSEDISEDLDSNEDKADNEAE